MSSKSISQLVDFVVELHENHYVQDIIRLSCIINIKASRKRWASIERLTSCISQMTAMTITRLYHERLIIISKLNLSKKITFRNDKNRIIVVMNISHRTSVTIQVVIKI